MFDEVLASRHAVERDSVLVADDGDQAASKIRADLEHHPVDLHSATHRHTTSILWQEHARCCKRRCSRGRENQWPRRFSNGRSLPRLLRGDMPREPLVRTFGVIDPVKLINLRLQLVKGIGEGLLIEMPEQGLVKAFVFTLRGRLIWLSRDRFNTKTGDVVNELSHDSAPRGV